MKLAHVSFIVYLLVELAIQILAVSQPAMQGPALVLLGLQTAFPVIVGACAWWRRHEIADWIVAELVKRRSGPCRNCGGAVPQNPSLPQ